MSSRKRLSGQMSQMELCTIISMHVPPQYLIQCSVSRSAIALQLNLPESNLGEPRCSTVDCCFADMFRVGFRQGNSRCDSVTPFQIPHPLTLLGVPTHQVKVGTSYRRPCSCCCLVPSSGAPNGVGPCCWLKACGVEMKEVYRKLETQLKLPWDRLPLNLPEFCLRHLRLLPMQ